MKEYCERNPAFWGGKQISLLHLTTSLHNGGSKLLELGVKAQSSEARGLGAVEKALKTAPQRRRFLPHFNRYIDNNGKESSLLQDCDFKSVLCA